MAFKVLYKSILHCSVHRVTASILYIMFSPSAALLPFRYTSLPKYSVWCPCFGIFRDFFYNFWKNISAILRDTCVKAFIKSILKSLVVPVIWLAQIGAIYSQIAPFLALNHIIFPANELAGCRGAFVSACATLKNFPVIKNSARVQLKVARDSFHFPQTSFTNSFPNIVWFIVSVWNLPQ